MSEGPTSEDVSASAAGPQGKLLALDVGLARIGVAVCDPLQLLARPLRVIERRSRNEDFGVLADLVSAEEATAVICGLPLHMDGSESDQSATTRKWAGRLAFALRALLDRPVPIYFWDERLSSYAANEWMDAERTDSGGRRSGKGAALGARMDDDAYAAAVILQGYVDARRRGESTPYGAIHLPPRDKAKSGAGLTHTRAKSAGAGASTSGAATE